MAYRDNAPAPPAPPVLTNDIAPSAVYRGRLERQRDDIMRTLRRAVAEADYCDPQPTPAEKLEGWCQLLGIRGRKP